MNSPSKKIIYDFGEIFLREDNIFQANILKNSHVDKAEVKIVIDAMQQLSKGNHFPAIIFLGEFVEVSKSAREYAAKPDKPTATTAIAFVINNMGHKIVGNFFLSVNKPLKPIRFFTDEKLALKWLEVYQQKNQG